MKKLTPLGTTAKVVNKTYGVYVHFPWCLQKCPYCDFLSVAAERPQIPQKAYADAVCREVSQRASQLGAVPIHSVFYGGGTPSLWAAEHIGRTLDTICRCFAAEPELEVTVECNPSSFSESYARELVAAGVNRVSLGVQGLEQQRLRFLGRLHDGPQALDAVRAAIAGGVPRVSADLIYGVYQQPTETAVREVRQVAALGVSHLSAYALTIEPGTAFGAQQRKGSLPLAPEDHVAESFQGVSDAMIELGFDHYEISNFGRAGAFSRHNLGYWLGEPYLGIGCGAWGTLAPEHSSTGAALRYRNTVVPERYLGSQRWPEPLPDQGRSGPGQLYQQLEPLDAETLLSERLMLGLRLATGVDLEQLEADLGLPVLTPQRRTQIEKLTERGRLVHQGATLRIPRESWLLADGTIAQLL